MAINNKNIGYIICESVQEPNVEIVKEDTIEYTDIKTGELKKESRVVAHTILQTADAINRNRRIYPEDELFPQLESERTLLLLKHKQMLGECGHPLDTALTRQQTIDKKLAAVSYSKFWTEGKHVWGEYKGYHNEYGQAVDLDLREGAIPEFSLRALGSVEPSSKGAVVRNLKMITYDNVIYQSDFDAYTRKIVSESADDTTMIRVKKDNLILENGNGNSELFVPIMTDDVRKFVIAESANLKLIKESFDVFFDTIRLDEDGSHIVMSTKEGDMLVITLEQYINNEILDFATRKAGLK